MADNLNDPLGRPPDFRSGVTEHVAGLVDANSFAKFGEWLLAVALQIFGKIVEWVLRFAIPIMNTLALAVARAEDANQEGFNQLAATAVEDMFGVKMAADTFHRRAGRGARADGANQIGDMLLKAFSGQAGGGGAGGLQPSDEPAKAFLSAMAQIALEGWVEGWVVEAATLGSIETFGELDDTISHVLGLGRASASVHGPLVRHLITTPLEWKVLKAHTPTLLPTSTLLKRYLSDKISRDEVYEELGRQGYSAQRVDHMIAEATPRFSVEEAIEISRLDPSLKTFAFGQLREQGWDAPGAELKIKAAQLRRVAAIQDNAAAALLRAFVNHDIEKSQLTSGLQVIIPDADERAAYELVADIQNETSIRHLSAGEVRDAVKREIVPIAFYRHWLEREGYPIDEATTLEILLRTEIDDTKKAAQHRADVEAERAAEKAAREEAAKQKAAALEQQHAVARRGQLGELRRAAVRGLIPIARVEEVLTPIYDADTVAIYMAQVEADRADYLAAQQKREDAEKRAQTKHIDVGQLQAAVLAGILTPDEFAARLRRDGMTDEDVTILRATLEARLQDIADAKAARRDAEAAAKRRSIDLTRFESLVRRGHRSLDDYAALLQSLGFDDASRAAMRELLELQIADDTAARTLRDQAAARAKVKGLTLEQARRGVVLGAMSDGDFQKYLVDAGYTADAQRVLLAELRRDVADAEAARRKREEASAARGPRELPLATLTRAARLGIIAPAAYQARLKTLNYTDDDVSIEMELLLAEMADDAAARQRAEDLKAKADAPRALSLAQIERAVKLGEATIGDYRAAAAQLYAPDDVDLLARVLQDELDALEAARARKEQLDNQTDPAQTLSLATIAKAVKLGQATIDDYRAAAAAIYAADDADLLARVLQEELDALEAARARKEQLENQTDPAKVLSLTTLAKAVKLGQASVADYAAAASAIYASDDVDLLVRVLEAELEPKAP